jgi:F-type H+-transporting ATPase subunit a
MKMASPLALEPLFHLGAVPITAPVVVTWAIMALLLAGALWLRRGLSLRPARAQAVAELVVGAIDAQIREVLQADPAPYRALIGTVFLYVLVANWSSLVPGLSRPPPIWKPMRRWR